jgi:hypothetical protein
VNLIGGGYGVVHDSGQSHPRLSQYFRSSFHNCFHQLSHLRAYRLALRSRLRCFLFISFSIWWEHVSHSPMKRKAGERGFKWPLGNIAPRKPGMWHFLPAYHLFREAAEILVNLYQDLTVGEATASSGMAYMHCHSPP